MQQHFTALNLYRASPMDHQMAPILDIHTQSKEKLVLYPDLPGTC